MSHLIRASIAVSILGTVSAQSAPGATTYKNGDTLATSVIGDDFIVYGDLVVPTGNTFAPQTLSILRNPASTLSPPASVTFNGGLIYGSAISIDSVSTLTVNTAAAAASLSNGNLVTINSGFNVSGNTTNNGTIALNAGSNLFSGSFTSSYGSSLSGDGSVESPDFALNGTIDPDSPAGVGSIGIFADPAVTFSGGVLIDLNFSGAVPVADEVTFGGALTLTPQDIEGLSIDPALIVNIPTLAAGQSLTPGTSFDIVAAGAITGEFALYSSLDVLDEDGATVGYFDLTYGATAVTLTYVPEPTLLIAALPAAALLRRRRKL